MCIYLNRWTHLIEIAPLWIAATVDATPWLRAVCDDPKGAEIRYGTSLWELDDGTIETSPTEYMGAQLVLRLEPRQPKTLLVIWRLPGAFDIADDCDQHHNANIIPNTASQLTAIHHQTLMRIGQRA